MDTLYTHVIRWVREQPWALMPETFAVLTDMLRFRAGGGRLTPEEIRGRIGAGVKAERPREQKFDPATGDWYREAHDAETGQPLGYRSQRGTALRADASVVHVLGVIGVISQRAAMADDMSGPGGTSIERLTSAFRASMKDPQVSAVVFDIDSPGGGVYGVQELAEEIRGARGDKPIVAVANSLAASAAYWLASAADEVVVTPSGEVGSVGVYSAHEDLSKLLEKEGVKVTLISAGKFKVEGNPFEPLTEEALVAIQGRVDDYYHAFTKAVAKGRGVSVDDVRRGFGQGRVVGAKQAVDDRMADRVETLDAAVRRVGAARKPAPAAAASAPNPAVVAELEAAEATMKLL